MPVITAPATLDEKLVHLEAILGEMDLALIGYSGGVDSAMLAVAAHRVLGDRAIAVTANSPSYASGELERARQITQQFGIRHEVVETDEMSNPDYAKNPTNRCYFCKQELFIHMGQLAQDLSASHILYGQNADDVGDFRPGAQAAADYGVRAPLQEAGLTKQDVRDLAQRWQVPVWNRPAMACLSSRVPYGTPITAQILSQVDRAEQIVRRCGFAQLRVRHHLDLARIELPANDIDLLLADTALSGTLAQDLSGIGYQQISVDLRGFRSGSLNEVLMPAAGSPDQTLAQAQSLLSQLGSVPRLEKRDQMLIIQTTAAAIGQLAAPQRRLELLVPLENLGFRYLALNLIPLPN